MPEVGSFVEARGRVWLVEDCTTDGVLPRVLLSCVDDDAQGETTELIWDAEIGARARDEEAWASVGSRGTDDARLFAGYLRTIRWNTSTAADRDLFQAPFRAGIRLDPYQLLPLRKALRLPRVNMLVADDVGLGKTVEAGLILRELLLRRRVDFVVVAAPPAMTIQWQEELAAKFGLAFQIIDRALLEELRRTRGFVVNPWATGSRFIISHKLLTDETYTAGLRQVLQDFKAKTLFILDEAHHAAPSGGGRYAIESQFTKDVRDLAGRFEHRLFLSATPHNGHSNSFATLLELLDPQRFTRGMDIHASDLEPIMVRRLKSDLRKLGEQFPERVVERIALDGLPAETPELRLADLLAAYGELREKRISGLKRDRAAQARLAYVGLQQRLLSSVAAFAKTLRVHQAGLEKAAQATLGRAFALQSEEDIDIAAPATAAEEEEALEALAREEDAWTKAATGVGVRDATAEQLASERAAVDQMLELAEAHRRSPDARVRWLCDWIEAHLFVNGRWTDRRLIIFTEYEDTRRYLEDQLRRRFGEALDEEERLATFTGVTSSERREAIKRAFNDPTSPLRILVCTDAAREGINLQQQCHDLVHFDLPWNPARLEQRNGRVDRKLQPSPQVFCRYFVYKQRPEDVVLDALVQKTETIQRELGAIGEVLQERVAKRLADRGIDRATAKSLAETISGEDDPVRLAATRRDLDDEPDRRMTRLERERDELARALERARVRVGVDPAELEEVVGLALERAGGNLRAVRAGDVAGVHTFALSDHDSVFAADPSWARVLDDLRERRLKRGEKPSHWRAETPVRRISFEPAIDEVGRDAAGVVQVHLEHRLVRRLLSRFLAAGFQSGLNRACVVRSATQQPRAILLGRLALYGPGAARLHEEILAVTAEWRDRERDQRPLKALAEEGQAEARVLERLEQDLKGATAPDASIVDRVAAWTSRDLADLREELETRAAKRREEVARELAQRGEAEALGLTNLLKAQIERIRAEENRDDRQLTFAFDEAEQRQREADRRSWERKVTRLDDELEREPQRLRDSFAVRAARLEPIGIVYLWPSAQ